MRSALAIVAVLVAMSVPVLAADQRPDVADLQRRIVVLEKAVADLKAGDPPRQSRICNPENGRQFVPLRSWGCFTKEEH